MFSKPALWCLISAFLFGLSPTFSKYLLSDIQPILLAALLYLGAGMATLPSSGMPNIRSKEEWRRILGAIFFGGILGPVLLLYGINQTSAATASLFLNMESVATVILGGLFFREHINKNIFIACILVTLGGGILSFDAGFTINLGCIWILLACVCWGLDNHYTALIEELSPTQSTCIKGLCAGIFNLLVYLLLFSNQSFPTFHLLFFALCIGAGSYGVSIVLYITGAQQLGATKAQLIFSAAPYFGVISAYFFLLEPLTLHHLIASFCMIAALLIQNRDTHQHTHTHHKHTHGHWHQHNDLHHDHQHVKHHPTLLGWHNHQHEHETHEHKHAHHSDLHHRHH